MTAAHEAVLGLDDPGLMSKRTNRVFDEMCLATVEEVTPEDMRDSASGERESGGVRFARYLNVTTCLASQWESGGKRPRGASPKLATLVEKNGLSAVA